jgi:hypothetical protein
MRIGRLSSPRIPLVSDVQTNSTPYPLHPPPSTHPKTRFDLGHSEAPNSQHTHLAVHRQRRDPIVLESFTDQAATAPAVGPYHSIDRCLLMPDLRPTPVEAPHPPAAGFLDNEGTHVRLHRRLAKAIEPTPCGTPSAPTPRTSADQSNTPAPQCDLPAPPGNANAYSVPGHPHTESDVDPGEAPTKPTASSKTTDAESVPFDRFRGDGKRLSSTRSSSRTLSCASDNGGRLT